MAESSTKITLSRALKVKNRLAYHISQLDTLIATYNSTTEDGKEYNVRELYKQRLEVGMRLVAVKTLITLANVPVQKSIYELAECKSLAAQLKAVNTRHGTVVEGYGGAKITYVAQFRKGDIDREVRKIEVEIDRLQDELDAFNARTLVEIEQSTLEFISALPASETA